MYLTVYITEFRENVFATDGLFFFFFLVCKFCGTKISADSDDIRSLDILRRQNIKAENRKRDQMKNKSQQLGFTAMTSKKKFF